MTEAVTTRQTAADPVAQGANSTAQDIVASPAPNLEHTRIHSNFTQSPSTYWALAVPLLSARYTAEAINNFFKPRRKWYSQLRKELEETPSQVEKLELKDTVWASLVGGGMVAVTGFYTVSTYGDMKRQFKEAVGWELGKEPDKVNLIDMVRSKNVLVREASRNLVSRTAKRFSAHLPFFSFLVPSPFRVNGEKVAMDAWIKGANPLKVGDTPYTKFLGPKDSVNLGVGTNAFYLASDALGRKRTFFEELQKLIDTKINHKDELGQIITTQDIVSLYDREMRGSKNAAAPKMSSPEWQSNMKLFEHVADLMNQTYENVPRKGYSDFTIPKLIYLMGMGLIKSDEPEKSAAYVEVANRYGIPAVKKVASDVESGVSLDAALAPFPAAIPCIRREEPGLQGAEADNTMLKSMGIAPEPATVPAQKSFANESLKKARPEATAATHAERVAQTSGVAAGLSA